MDLPKNKETYFRCLSHRTVIFIGDYTTRDWYYDISHRLKLNVTLANSKDVPDEAWQRHVRAEVPSKGIVFEWMPHEHPFYGKPGSMCINHKSVTYRLDLIGANIKALILLHWHLHISRCCDHVAFREHVKNAKAAIVRLLKRSPEAIIFIKGPHAHTFRKEREPTDYVKRFIEQVLYKEFINLQNNVIFLENWELSTSMENTEMHGTLEINNIMVHNFMSLACYRSAYFASL